MEQNKKKIESEELKKKQEQKELALDCASCVSQGLVLFGLGFYHWVTSLSTDCWQRAVQVRSTSILSCSYHFLLLFTLRSTYLLDDLYSVK